jgi:CubicO group peptidase (beta-lactamase class C family)
MVTDQSSVEHVIRTFVPQALERYRVAGASIAIVEDGQVQGLSFGVVDPGTNDPIDPFTTRFHIASVTKLITALAVVQLAESGRLSLEDPIARHLPPPLAEGFGHAPIRIRHLLTHTAGFSDRWVAMAADSPAGVWPLQRYLSERRPALLDAPGTVIRYSNYGYALAGHIVEQVSGRSYADYVTTHILAPLAASRSYVGPREPDRSDAPGFFYRDRVTMEPRVYEHGVPAGGVHAPVTELARIVGAVLGDGSFGGVRLVSQAGARQLRQSQFSADPRLPGWGFGLYGYGPVEHDAWIAGGELPGMSTRVLLVPQERLAVIVAVNRKDPTLAMALFAEIRAQRRAPTTVAPPTRDLLVPPVHFKGGRYRAMFGDSSSFLKVAALFAPEVRLQPRDAGEVLARFSNAGRADEIWRSTAGRLWVDPSGHPVAAFSTGDAGEVTQIFLSDDMAGLATMERVRWWDTGGVTLDVMAVATGSAVATLLAWPFFRHRSAGVLARPLVTVAGLTLLFVVGFSVGLAELAVLHDDRFAFGIPLWFAVVLWIPLAIATALGWLLVRWRAIGRDLRWPSTLAVGWSSVVTLALLAVAWHWNLVGAFN